TAPACWPPRAPRSPMNRPSGAARWTRPSSPSPSTDAPPRRPSARSAIAGARTPSCGARWWRCCGGRWGGKGGARAPASPAGAALSGVVVEVAGEPRLVARALVRETVPLAEITPVPGVAAPLVGLAQVRGRVVPVLDLDERPGAGRRGVLVVVEVDGQRV